MDNLPALLVALATFLPALGAFINSIRAKKASEIAAETAEQSRKSISAKVEDVHNIVNGQNDALVDRVQQLEQIIQNSDEDIPPNEVRTSNGGF